MTTTNATPVHEFVHKNPAKKDGKFHAAARGLPIPAAIPVVKAKYVIKTLTNGPNSKGIKNVGFKINGTPNKIGSLILNRLGAILNRPRLTLGKTHHET